MNKEGYYDFTAELAIQNVENEHHSGFMPFIFVCSPFTGDELDDISENIKKTQQYCRYVVDHGGIPVAPHLLLPQFMDNEEERNLMLIMGSAMLSFCQQLWIFESPYTEGMNSMINKAKKKRIYIKRIFDADKGAEDDG